MGTKSISRRPWLLLPIEVKNRELDAKVMLSCIGAARGFGVLFGRNGFNLNGKFPRGVYLDKCISPYKLDVLTKQVKTLGNKLAILDEEGLVYQSKKLYIANRTSRATVDLASLIFTWGDAQLQVIDNEYGIPDKVISTGSTRADLWQKEWHQVYEKEVESITEQIGEFILIPANFSPAHHVDPINFSLSKRGYTEQNKNSKKLTFKEDRYLFREKIFNKFVELIGAIAEASPDLTVVLRPHPNDDLKVWAKFKKNWPENVKIIYDGNVSPWIIASKILIHNSCTTGVEAFAMGKPTIAYMPYFDKRYEQNIPNPLSQKSSTVEGVLQLIQNNLEKKGLGKENEKIELYNYHIRNDKNILAGDRMFDALEKLNLPESEFKYSSYGLTQKICVVARRVNRRIGDFTGKHEFSYAYRKQKNPGISLEEIQSLVGRYKKIMNRWDNVLVEQVGEDLFCFYCP
ncbi:hypothetical protein UWK_02431 [Desulfocapsa sulfexigens DSM 10523]|uniref:Surface carbohydrate biosynthesis protein n=1 Tax=Desulfocapsa sulfexigens (strain DSM 10523 / SB164P1) TaxID=1167006 RepID=M1PH82_DESSD|nr:surface carbohydrate biosynthesis protein [Desulfocapsa sulfexigens]AGF78970.1 hypothetical protein UWK_02431 [Desulfocapsa sulfexigens DSM 10523]